ncbi:class I SAM-dependent methyltransferase [Pseudolabrys sp. FHR47]|uniref:class I SAM-dependent methyltransferase n=1 Tax=Pseudolabrys sp. FHR47 TaxID=2562284 RepID=UPI0010BE3919|nr:class I SAM-dependent methyltransferase [Pseudolabrys sp. FHR47]
MPDVDVVFDNAVAYERFMGAWSRSVGEKFLTWLAPPPNERWLEIGCGTGAFSALILARCAPSALIAVDPSAEQVEHARKLIAKADFRVANALSLPFGDAEFDVIASALVLHFLPDRRKAFAEMRRVAKSGAVVAGYTWNRTPAATFAPYAPMARAIKAIGIEPTLSPLVPEAAPDGLRESLETTGFHDIDITLIEATRTFASFDEFWQIQTLTFHPIGKTIATMSEDQKCKLRDAVRDIVPPGADGSISYSARAIAYRARKLSA